MKVKVRKGEMSEGKKEKRRKKREGRKEKK